MNPKLTVAVVLAVGLAGSAAAYVFVFDDEQPQAEAPTPPPKRPLKRPEVSPPSATVAQLRQRLESDFEPARKAAMAKLARRKPSKEVLAALVFALHSKDDGISTSASEVLRRFGPRAVSVAPEVAECIEAQRPCGAWAGLVLGSFGPAALPQIRTLASARRPAARRKAAYALALMRCHGPPVVKVLRRLAKDSDKGTRDIARKALRDPCTRRR